jgi:hypothetical protein
MKLVNVLLLFLTTTAYGQCYNCGMFGMLADHYEDIYVARFTVDLDSIQLESAKSCEVFTAPVTVTEVKARRRMTRLELYIHHPKFNDVPYRIRYPSGSWGIVNGGPGYW